MNRLKRLLSYFGNAFIYYVLAFCLKSYILNKVIGQLFTDTNSFFSLVLVKNNGAAFNLFAGFQDWLVIFAIAIILAITVYLSMKKLYLSENFLMMLSLFSAGIAGNAIERYTLGYVEDFIKINLFNFPVFNLNDIMITVGAVTIALAVINDKRREIQENKDAEDDLIYGD
ncbi:MAG: signal peptidase II [bacterium]|nr:signal peptidase II [bacterium]